MPYQRPAWHSWYMSRKWEKLTLAQLRDEPFCRMCTARGVIGVPAIVVDHIDPVRGSYKRFWFGARQSLCKTCHDGAKKYLENRGFEREIGLDGFPIDKKHPFFTGKSP